MAPPPNLTPVSAKPVFDSIVAQVSTTGVWQTTPDPTISAGLHKVIDEFAAKGYKVGIVYYNSPERATAYRDLATSVQKETGGTVIVIGQTYAGTASDHFSRVQLENAQDNMSFGQPVAVANQYYDRMLEHSQPPWSGITAGLLLAIVVGAVVARVLMLRGRRRTQSGAGSPGGTATDETSASESDTAESTPAAESASVGASGGRELSANEGNSTSASNTD